MHFSLFAGGDAKFRGRNPFPRPASPSNTPAKPVVPASPVSSSNLSPLSGVELCGRRACRDARNSVFTSRRERISRFSLPSGSLTPFTVLSMASYLSGREPFWRFPLPTGCVSAMPLCSPHPSTSASSFRKRPKECHPLEVAFFCVIICK